MNKIWDGPFHYLDSAATSAGVNSAEYLLTVSATTGEPHALRLCADLAKLGARVTRDGETITVRVSSIVAQQFMDANLYGGEIAHS